MSPSAKTKDVILQAVDRKLFDTALKKCREQRPPISLKWKIVELVERWVKTGI